MAECFGRLFHQIHSGPVADIARLPLKLNIAGELAPVSRNGVAALSVGDVEPR